MKKVLNFVKGRKDDKKDQRINPQISVEITNPSGQKITTDDEHIIGLQHGHGYNIDVNGKDKSLSKIHKAAWDGNLDKLKLHSKKIDLNTPDYLNRTCLHLAVAQGHTEVAWYLLNNNASTTAVDNDGLTPFLKAVECGHKDCANLLIECGVTVNSCDKQGNTALHIAARSGFYNIASLLLKEGANINVPNNSGEYPLHMATNCDHREMVELLIRYSANVDVLDQERRTPLMLAARNGFSTIIKVLIDNGALLDAADSNGWTAEDYAQFGGHQDLIDLLKVLKNDESLDHSDKLSVQSSDQSEHVNFENANGEVNEEHDSPKSCVIPPALEPPRSWDLIQSGVIDQDGVERRKGMLTLGLKREESGSSEYMSPSALSPASEMPIDITRLSPEPNRDLLPTPERRTRSPLERAHSLDLSSDQDSPINEKKEDFEVKIVHELLKDNQYKDKYPSDNNNTLILDNTMPPDEFASNNNDEFETKNTNHTHNLNTYREEKTFKMETSQSYDNLEERISYDTAVSSLDEYEGKSLSIEIIQSTGNLDETLSICTVPTKNLFRESHSLEMLECDEEVKSYKNKRHVRNKSITLSGQPQFWKSVDVLHKPTYERGSIDAQLVCYDEALRQLAEVAIQKPKEPPKPPERTVSNESNSPKEKQHNNSIDIDAEFENDDLNYAPFPVDLDNELESLEGAFPPPPMHFLENDDNEIIGLQCDHEILEISLPPPISMLTPIKENQQENDSLSINVDSNASSSTDQPIQDDRPTSTSPQYLVDDVFLEDGQIPDRYDKYFVDVKALNIQPANVDLSQLLFPSDSPTKKHESNSPEPPGKASKSETEPLARPLRRKRKQLLAMRGAGVGGSKDTDNEIDDVEDDEDSEEEDPPFWHSTDKGGYFARQNTVVTLSKSSKEFSLAGSSQSKIGGTRSGSSEGETASASDTPKHSTSPLPIKGPLHPHHCEVYAEKGKLEETAVELLDKAERLKYELEDCRQAEASRDDTISILQNQISRLEGRYARAQEELCMLRQRASTAEVELNHLRELCTNLTRDKAEMYKELSKRFDIASSQVEEQEDVNSHTQNHLHFMIKHLEEAKRQEEEKTQRLVHHLEEVLLTNQSMLKEREGLIAQNIADVRKLQEDTICWKERYEELAAKLEMVESNQDPRLIEAQDTIATLKRTIVILQQEKSMSNPRLLSKVMLQNYCGQDKSFHEAVGSSSVDSEWNNVVNLFFELRDLLDDCNKEAQHSWAIIDKVQRSASIITLELEDLEREISDQSVDSEPDTIGIEPYCDHLLNSLYLKKEKVSVETQVETWNKENILQKIKCPIYMTPQLEQFAAYFTKKNVICTNIQSLIQNAVTVEVIPEPYIRRFYSLDENFIQMYSLSRYNVINPTYSRSIDCLETLLNRCVITELDDCYELECYNAMAYKSEDSARCEKPIQETKLIKYCEFSDIRLIDGTKRVAGRLKTESPEPSAEREKSEVRFIAVVKSNDSNDNENASKRIKGRQKEAKQPTKSVVKQSKPVAKQKTVAKEPKPDMKQSKPDMKQSKPEMKQTKPVIYQPKPVTPIRPKTTNTDKSVAKISTPSYRPPKIAKKFPLPNTPNKPRKVPKAKTSIEIVESSTEEVLDEEVEENDVDEGVQDEEIQDEEAEDDKKYFRDSYECESRDFLEECEEFFDRPRSRSPSKGARIVMFDCDKPFKKNRFEDCDDRMVDCDERVACDELVDDRMFPCDEQTDYENQVDFDDQIVDCEDIFEYDDRFVDRLDKRSVDNGSKRIVDNFSKQNFSREVEKRNVRSINENDISEQNINLDAEEINIDRSIVDHDFSKRNFSYEVKKRNVRSINDDMSNQNVNIDAEEMNIDLSIVDHNFSKQNFNQEVEKRNVRSINNDISYQNVNRSERIVDHGFSQPNFKQKRNFDRDTVHRDGEQNVDRGDQLIDMGEQSQRIITKDYSPNVDKQSDNRDAEEMIDRSGRIVDHGFSQPNFQQKNFDQRVHHEVSERNVDRGDQLIDLGEQSRRIIKKEYSTNSKRNVNRDSTNKVDQYRGQKGDYEPIGREPSVSQYRRNSGQTINVSEQKIIGDVPEKGYRIVIGSNVKYSPAKRNETKQKSSDRTEGLHVSDVQAKVHPVEELSKGSQTEDVKKKLLNQETSTKRKLITTSTQYDVIPEMTTETKLVSFPSRRESKNQETNTVSTNPSYHSYLALSDKKFCDIKRIRFKSKSTQLTPEDVIYFKRLKKMLKKSQTSVMSSSLKNFFSNFVNKNILSMNVELDKLTRQEIQNAKKIFTNILSFLKSDVDNADVRLEDLPTLNLNLDPNESILEAKSDDNASKLNENETVENHETKSEVEKSDHSEEKSLKIENPSCSQIDKKAKSDLLIYQPKNVKNEVYLQCSESKRKILKKYFQECKSLGLPVTMEKLFRDLKRNTNVKIRRKDEFSFRKYISRQQASCEKEIVNILRRLNEGDIKEDSQIWLSKCHHKLLVSLEQLYSGNFTSDKKRKSQFSHQAKELLQKLKEKQPVISESCKTIEKSLETSSNCEKTQKSRKFGPSSFSRKTPRPISKKLQTSEKRTLQISRPKERMKKSTNFDKLVCLRQSISRPNSEAEVSTSRSNSENIPKSCEHTQISWAESKNFPRRNSDDKTEQPSGDLEVEILRNSRSKSEPRREKTKADNEQNPRAGKNFQTSRPNQTSRQINQANQGVNSRSLTKPNSRPITSRSNEEKLGNLNPILPNKPSFSRSNIKDSKVEKLRSAFDEKPSTSRPNHKVDNQVSRPNTKADNQISRPNSKVDNQISRPNIADNQISRPNNKVDNHIPKPNSKADIKLSRPNSKADNQISRPNSKVDNQISKPKSIKLQTTKPKSSNKICQVSIHSVKPQNEVSRPKSKLQISNKPESKDLKDEKIESDGLNDFNKLSNVMDVLDVDVDPQNIFKTLSQSSNVKKEESNSKESGYNESFERSEGSVKCLKKISSKNIVTYKNKTKKKLLKSFENKIAEIRKTQKNYLEEIDTALKNCEKPSRSKICDFETLCDIHEKERVFKKRDFNVTKEKLKECIKSQSLRRSRSYEDQKNEKEDIKRFVSQESYKMILIQKCESREKPRPSEECSFSFFSSESYSISYKPSEKILVKDYDRNSQMKNLTKYQKEIRDLKKDIERKMETEKSEGFRSSLDSIEFWKSLEKSSKKTDRNTDFSVYTNLTGNMVSDLCLDEEKKTKDLIKRWEKKSEYEMYPEAMSKWLKTPSIEEMERQKKEKIKKKEKRKFPRPLSRPSELLSTIATKKPKESPKGDFKNIKLVPKFNDVLQKNYKTKLKKSTVESFLKALQEYWNVLDESLRLYNLALKKDNLKSISKFYSKTKHKYCKERSMLLYKHLVSVDKSRKKMCGDFDGSSPKAMSLPVKYDKDMKKVDSKHKVNKTTLEYVKNELVTLKSQINRSLFAEIRNEIANSSMNESELKKIVHSIDLELEKIKSSEKQIDLLIEDIKQRIELEGDLDDLQTRFEKDFVSKFEYECSKISQDEALRKLKQEAITETKNQLNEKLTEINDLIQLQIQEQSRQEKERNNSEISLRKKLEHIGDVLQTELNNIQSVLSGCQTEDNEKKDLKSKEYSKRRNMFEQEEKNIKETSPKQGKGSVVKAKQSLEEKINEDLKDKYLKKK